MFYLTLANAVTILRIVFIPLVISFLLLGFYGLAAILFLLLSFSDALDGYIARRFKQVSDLGKNLDPLADKILVITALIALVGLGKADSIPVMIIAAREFLMSLVRSTKVIAASPMAKSKTVVQVIAIFMLILSLPYAGWMLWLAVILSLISGGAYLWKSRTLKSLKLN